MGYLVQRPMNVMVLLSSTNTVTDEAFFKKQKKAV